MESIFDILNVFQHQLSSNTLHHAWIIEGGKSKSRLELAEQMIGSLLGEKAAHEKFHPNLIWVKEEDTHGVNDMRKVIHGLERSSWDGSWKVAVVAGAECLNPQAQNALLKVFEEPPEKTVIVLMGSISHSLLPTLYSRAGHYILKSNENDNTVVKSDFESRWKKALQQVVLNQNYDLLLALQLELNQQEVPKSKQIEMLLSAARNLILSPGQDDVFALPHLLKRWEAMSQYCAEVRELNLDSSRIVIKLSHFLLADVECFSK